MKGSFLAHVNVGLPLALAIALAATVPLSAARPGRTKYRCGVQLSIVDPRGDMQDGSRIPDYNDPIDGPVRFDNTPAFTAEAGYGLTLFGEAEWTDKSACRLKAEYLPFGKKTGWDLKWGATIFTLNADYVYSLQSHERGWFLFGGVGWVRAGSTVKDTRTGWDGSTNSTCMSAVAGAGFNFFAGFCLELKYTRTIGLTMDGEQAMGLATQYPGMDANIGADWSYLQMSVGYRF